ncbi:MAG: exosortase/archaeosortase family protein [Opitutae bacterium]|nr:exosortase/archaeosortase family protein [Opitutae bacterium]
MNAAIERRGLWLAFAAVAVAALAQLWRALEAAGGAWGWVALPLLAAYFARERWRGAADGARAGEGASVAVALAILAALVPLRLLLAAFPGWPAAEWLASGLWVALALLLVARGWGRSRARTLAFPVAFPLVALPWPAFVTADAMEALRRGTAEFIAEIFSLLGEPAAVNGTVIELRQGLIGVEEACGGIRSLQAAVVVGLAIGELRRDSAARRVGWVLAGVAVAVVANTARLAALTAACAQGGVAAVARWHDPAAAGELLLVFGALAGLAIWRGLGGARRESAAARVGGCAGAWRLGAVALAGVVVVEAVAWSWFRGADERAPAQRWTVDLGRGAREFVAPEFTPIMHELLREDAHQLGEWRDAHGRRRAGYVVEWRTAHTGALVLASHHPGVCLPAAGSRVVRTLPDLAVEAGGARLPFRVTEFASGRETFWFFYLTWSLSAAAPTNYRGDAMMLTWRERWGEVRAHRRDEAVRAVGLAIFDARSVDEARVAAQDEIARMVRAGER